MKNINVETPQLIGWADWFWGRQYNLYRWAGDFFLLIYTRRQSERDRVIPIDRDMAKEYFRHMDMVYIKYEELFGEPMSEF